MCKCPSASAGGACTRAYMRRVKAPSSPPCSLQQRAGTIGHCPLCAMMSANTWKVRIPAAFGFLYGGSACVASSGAITVATSLCNAHCNACEIESGHACQCCTLLQSMGATACVQHAADLASAFCVCSRGSSAHIPWDTWLEVEPDCSCNNCSAAAAAELSLQQLTSHNAT